jgi:hypothetical protein
MNMELIHGFIIKFSRQAGAQEQLWKRDKQATSQLNVTRTPNSKNAKCNKHFCSFSLTPINKLNSNITGNHETTHQLYRERIQIMLYVHNISYGLVGMIEDDKHTYLHSSGHYTLLTPKKNPILNTFIVKTNTW